MQKEMIIIKAKSVTVTALFIAINAVLSQISFPLPISSIPFSMGIMAAFLSGAVLKPKQALTAQVLYLLLGAVGLPVFSQFRGGAAVLAGPTGGFLIGYIFIALIVSFVSNKKRENIFLRLFVSMLAGLIVCYGVGTLWFSIVTGNNIITALTLCVYPFAALDVLKAAIGAYLAAAIKKSIRI